MSPRTRPKPRPSVRHYRPTENQPAGQPGPFLPVCIVVPGKPMSVNRATTPIVRGGRSMKITTREGREYAARVKAAALKAMAGRSLLIGDLALRVVAYWPRRGADSDGPLKPTKDALQGVVYANDSAVCVDSTRRAYDPENPRVEITVGPDECGAGCVEVPT
jgi:Holliday junction resolvase RusA-like endonuclease